MAAALSLPFSQNDGAPAIADKIINDMIFAILSVFKKAYTF
jgi:hypothetical protein